MTEYKEPDRKDLKIQALREKISELENMVADLRVELTVTTDRYQSIIRNLNSELETHKEETQLEEKKDSSS